MSWILIIAMYSPGGDWVGKQELIMPTKASCYSAAKAYKGATDMMGIRYQGKCVQRDERGLNVGKEALD